MKVLNLIETMADKYPEALAFHSRCGEITYEELWVRSGKLAQWIDDELGNNKSPIPVYGHKSPEMIVCFLACVKSGRAYCPIDISMSEDRVNDIISLTGSSLVLATEELESDNVTVVSKEQILKNSKTGLEIKEDKWVAEKENFYIIFTSGSTGKPKGVQITYGNLTKFTEWMHNLGDSRKESSVFLNQAPFSFDLSVMDLYTSLTNGCTLWCIDKELQQDISATIDYIKSGEIEYWVSTPSFVDMCLADKKFNGENLKSIKMFYFCGEKLTVRTALKLRTAFPKAKIINTYGPTESTVAVTDVEITDEMLASGNELPIGIAKPGTSVYIAGADGNIAHPGEKGEIIIAGDTVSPGYYNNSEKTEEVFVEGSRFGEKAKVYRTGDEGYLTKEGMLYYSGRMDFQIKFHGYRIELGDIEKNLMSIDGISAAVVLPKRHEEKIRYLSAFVVAQDKKGDYADRKAVKESLKKKLPEYMIPKKVVFIEQMPLTDNGKVNRRKLEELL